MRSRMALPHLFCLQMHFLHHRAAPCALWAWSHWTSWTHQFLLASGPLLMPFHLLGTYCLPPAVQTIPFSKGNRPWPQAIILHRVRPCLPVAYSMDDCAFTAMIRCGALSTGWWRQYWVCVLLATVHSPAQHLGVGSGGTSVGVHWCPRLSPPPALCTAVDRVAFYLNPRGSACLPWART